MGGYFPIQGGSRVKDKCGRIDERLRNLTRSCIKQDLIALRLIMQQDYSSPYSIRQKVQSSLNQDRKMLGKRLVQTIDSVYEEIAK